MEFPRKSIPKLLQVRQRLDQTHIEDVEKTTADKLVAAGIKELVRPGSHIAITAGSRGIGGFTQILKSIASTIRTCGATPFIVPAMGSHGGATAEGQQQLLGRLGVFPDEVRAEIKSCMDTVCLGLSSSGAKAHFDRLAYEADGVIVLGRVKTHPESASGLASGLLKMTTIGLGKQIGAQEAHSHSLWASVKAVPELVLATEKILCGVAVVENAFREPVRIEVVPGRYEAFREADEKLLKIARKHLARIPFAELDVLVVDEIGKNISGSGMDTNVIGKWRVSGGPRKPNYKRIVALSLTAESMGNGLGIGMADFTTRRFMESFDPHATWINLLTATEPGARNTVEAQLPLVLPTDQAAIEVALYSCLSDNPRVCRIRNTASLDRLWISENLLAEAEGLEVEDRKEDVQ